MTTITAMSHITGDGCFLYLDVSSSSLIKFSLKSAMVHIIEASIFSLRRSDAMAIISTKQQIVQVLKKQNVNSMQLAIQFKEGRWRLNFKNDARGKAKDALFQVLYKT